MALASGTVSLSCTIMASVRGGGVLQAPVCKWTSRLSDQFIEPAALRSIARIPPSVSRRRNSSERSRSLLQESNGSRKWILKAELDAAPASVAESATPVASLERPEEKATEETEEVPVDATLDEQQAAESSEDAIESTLDIPEPIPAQPYLTLAAAAKVIPHPEKVAKGGEDAYFFSREGVPAVVCVADGVGGWAEDGVDPALYSKELVYHAQEAMEARQATDPRVLLSLAYEKTQALGAATVMVGMVDGEGQLSVANLGDSGLRVVRDGQVVFATPPHQHYFDCPYQLGPESPDKPKNAQYFEVSLREGDTLVAGSDGLFDNVFDRDIAAVVRVFGGADTTSAEHTAAALAALASKHASDTTYDSPYILEAIDQGMDVPFWMKILGKKLSGGKLDDITVVVAHVVMSKPEELAPAEAEEELARSEP